ncbi:hypothetical protein Nepgr_033131 [Nepenthes gracilis]|uniref:Uncharacterized protein n=1 Tax=Nepenthes gracilis TaxID=150966 RepID=A0AAD3Y6N6_NEPGR|nr:hypothetical protein Nepgr_033131 [Nepenthes gracilis]
MDSGCGAGVILTTPDGFEIKYSLKLDFPTTNNAESHEASLGRLAIGKGVLRKRYLAKAKETIQGFDKLTLVHTP